MQCLLDHVHGVSREERVVIGPPRVHVCHLGQCGASVGIEQGKGSVQPGFDDGPLPREQSPVPSLAHDGGNAPPDDRHSARNRGDLALLHAVEKRSKGRDGSAGNDTRDRCIFNDLRVYDPGCLDTFQPLELGAVLLTATAPGTQCARRRTAS